MNVLYVINDLSSGGAEKLVDDIVPILNENINLNVEVLLLRETNSVYQNLENNNIKVTKLNVKNLYNPIVFFKIISFFKKNKYDIIHAHLFPTLYWVALANLFNIRNKVKLIYTEHNVTNKRREKPFLNGIERFIYSRYDKVICISEAVHTELVHWLKVDSKQDDKFLTIYNGINTIMFRDAMQLDKSELYDEYQEADILLCMVARFAESKDHDTVIRAMYNLPSNFKLILVGTGPREEHIRKLTIEYDLTDRVVFLGERNDVPKIMKTIDFLIVSSNWEGFGLTAVEGMAAGKVVLASDVPGLNEVIRDKDLLFRKGSEIQLAQLISEICNDNLLYEKKEKLSLNNANRFSLDEMAINYTKLYFREINE